MVGVRVPSVNAHQHLSCVLCPFYLCQVAVRFRGFRPFNWVLSCSIILLIIFMTLNGKSCECIVDGSIHVWLPALKLRHRGAVPRRFCDNLSIATQRYYAPCRDTISPPNRDTLATYTATPAGAWGWADETRQRPDRPGLSGSDQYTTVGQLHLCGVQRAGLLLQLRPGQGPRWVGRGQLPTVWLRWMRRLFYHTAVELFRSAFREVYRETICIV